MNERGGIRIVGERVYARIRYGRNERVEERLPWATPATETEARDRAALIATLCEELVDAGRRDLVRTTAKEAARATSPVVLNTIRKAVTALAKTKPVAPSATTVSTFFDVAESWTSGELRKKYPDHVRQKESKLDRGRLRRYIYPHVKDVPITVFDVDHADLVMSKLPPSRVKTSAARRQIAQIINRILNLAVMPLRLIKTSPIPKGWLPHIEQKKHYTCLYPEEEATFLACGEIDEAFRLFIGILDREGMRVSELLDADWWQFNLEVGTFTATKTKTGDPRMWALRADVARAMRAWKEHYGQTKPKPFSDLLAEKDAKLYLAERLRDSLALAGVTRRELFESTEFTGKLRAHDMRATFVTVSLAEGKSDTWIRDRTAHKTTGMIDRYRRTARQFAELKLGALEDLDKALGWGITRGMRRVSAPSAAGSTTRKASRFRRRDSKTDRGFTQTSSGSRSWPTTSRKASSSSSRVGPPRSVSFRGTVQSYGNLTATDARAARNTRTPRPQENRRPPSRRRCPRKA